MPDLAFHGVVVEKKRMGGSGVGHSPQFSVTFLFASSVLSRCAAAFSIQDGPSSVNRTEEHRTRFPMDTVLGLRL